MKNMKNGKLHTEEEEGIEPLKVSLGGWLFNRSKGNLWDPKEEVPVVPFPVSCESGPHPIISKGVSSLVIRGAPSQEQGFPPSPHFVTLTSQKHCSPAESCATLLLLRLQRGYPSICEPHSMFEMVDMSGDMGDTARTDS